MDQEPSTTNHEPRTKRAITLWIAQGFGSGWAPVAPGTFGSVVGIVWTGILLHTGGWVGYLIGALLGIGISVWACGEAEKILQKKDPGCVVMDEIIALPFAFLPLVWAHAHSLGGWRLLEQYTTRDWFYVLIIFGLFRLFDITKPPPVFQSQSLPGGWGVTVDDMLAAGYTALCVGGIIKLWGI